MLPKHAQSAIIFFRNTSNKQKALHHSNLIKTTGTLKKSRMPLLLNTYFFTKNKVYQSKTKPISKSRYLNLHKFMFYKEWKSVIPELSISMPWNYIQFRESKRMLR